MLNFNDIFKSSFLENVSTFSLVDAVLALAISFVMGLFIFMVYKKTYSGVMYSASFGVSLIGMAMITTLVILAVTSNVVLSLGMVGALSIVRFRTAVKEPMDIAFMFWAIAVGIVLGAGLIPLAVIGSVIIGVILIIFSVKKVTDIPYILVVSCENKETEDKIEEIVKTQAKKYALKSKTVNKENVEIIYEVRIKDNYDLVSEVSLCDGVNDATLVTYNGEYM